MDHALYRTSLPDSYARVHAGVARALLTLGISLIVAETLSIIYGNDVLSIPEPPGLDGSITVAGAVIADADSAAAQATQAPRERHKDHRAPAAPVAEGRSPLSEVLDAAAGRALPRLIAMSSTRTSEA